MLATVVATRESQKIIQKITKAVPKGYIKTPTFKRFWSFSLCLLQAMYC
jgi:hypothetical protein